MCHSALKINTIKLYTNILIEESINLPIVCVHGKIHCVRIWDKIMTPILTIMMTLLLIILQQITKFTMSILRNARSAPLPILLQFLYILLLHKQSNVRFIAHNFTQRHRTLHA